MRVVVCGGGVIGACTAYFLALREVEVIVVERTGVACAASGKSGGFLALDWCDGSPLAGLARRSFKLHARLAAELDGGRRWGYRGLDTWSVLAGARREPGRGRAGPGPAWLGERTLVQGRLGTQATTAQVHPGRFTEAMLQAGVEVDGASVVEADAIVVAMGPWSTTACQWLPLPAVYGLKGNSLVYRTGGGVSADALFVELATGGGTAHTPEVFPRADGTTYVCGLSSRQALPDDPARVAPDPGAREALQAMTRAFAPGLADAPILATQACFRPVTRDGLPLLGPVPGTAQAFVATGRPAARRWRSWSWRGRRRGWTCAGSIRRACPRDEHRNLPAPPASVLVHSCRTEMDAIEVLDAGTRKRNPVPCTGQGRNSGCAVHIAAAPSAAQCC
jgi:glycine/D-amino acid oxidase-like deaminating enzyme